MFGKKCATEIHQINDRAVIGISPPGRELKTVTGAFTFFYRAITQLPDMRESGRIAVIFGVGTI